MKNALERDTEALINSVFVPCQKVPYIIFNRIFSTLPPLFKMRATIIAPTHHRKPLTMTSLYTEYQYPLKQIKASEISRNR